MMKGSRQKKYMHYMYLDLFYFKRLGNAEIKCDFVKEPTRSCRKRYKGKPNTILTHNTKLAFKENNL